MATAAPAAPATASPAPAAPPPAPATDAGAQPQTAKPIRPIPPPKLPGVFEDGPEDATARPAQARDASGRFAPGESTGVVQKAKPQAVEAEDGIPTPPGEPEPEPAAPKFEFAGKEYASQAEAEQAFRSVIGRQKHLEQTEGQLVKAAESARGWHAEAQRLQAELAAMRSQPAAQPEAVKPEANTGVDWEMYAEIERVAQEAGEPWKARKWLQDQIDAQRSAELAALRDELTAPWREQQAEAEAQAARETAANALTESMAAQTNPDGSPTFPEFRDPNTAREVGALWVSLGNRPEDALTPGGAVAAVALYRLARSMNLPANPSPAPAPAAPPAPNPAALAAAGLEGGRPMAPAAGVTRAMDPESARLIAGLKNTQLIRPGLGFEA